MKTQLHPILLLAALATFGVIRSHAAEPEPQPVEQQAAQPEEPVEVERPSDADESDTSERPRKSVHVHHTGEDVVVHVGGDSNLPADETADAVVAVFGSVTAAGRVHSGVVSVFGNTHVTGSVGESVASIMGDTYVDSEVGDAVVAMLGNVTLGPNAVVHHDVVAVGGKVISDPKATVHGEMREVDFGFTMEQLQWLKPWIDHCLRYARPLAFEPGLGWAWTIAFGFLAFYVLLALLFDGAVERCVKTLEQRPGQSVLASILTVLGTPVLLFLVMITVIGIALLPFLGIALFCMALFGKAVVLGALGRRVTRFTGVGPLSHITFAVLVGGLLVLGLYVVPVIGFIAYKLIGILGVGVVVYTLILALASSRENAALAAAGASAGGSSGTASGWQPSGEPMTSTTAAGDNVSPGTAGPTPSEPAAAIPPRPAELTAAAASTLPRAGFWIRIGALFIDFLLVAFVVNVLAPSGELTLLALAGYGALMWKLKSTTIGGIICHLRVVRTDGREIEWETAIVRALSCLLSLLPAGLGFLWIVFDKDRQAWHDKIAGTVVVRMPRP